MHPIIQHTAPGLATLCMLTFSAPTPAAGNASEGNLTGSITGASECVFHGIDSSDGGCSRAR